MHCKVPELQAGSFSIYAQAQGELVACNDPYECNTPRESKDPLALQKMKVMTFVTIKHLR